MKALAHEAESVLDLMRKNEARLDANAFEALLQAVETIQGMLGRLAQGEQEVVDPRPTTRSSSG